MGILFGGWAREEQERLASMSLEEIALEKDQREHPERYPEIMKARELQAIQNAKVYSIEGSPEVKIGDIIISKGVEMRVQDIIDDHLYVRTVTNNSSTDPHNGGTYLYEGVYKKLEAVGYKLKQE